MSSPYHVPMTAPVHLIDLNYLDIPGAIGAWVIDAPDGPVIIECGPHSCHDRLVAGLADLGHAPADVKHVVVTHIHLDHAGAAGWWAREGAHIHVHEFGARHLIDPAKLIASATRIYGDEMDRLWGEILAAPEDRVHEVRDNDVLRINGIELTALETPGHARHHHAFRYGNVCFTGDAAAMITPELPGVPGGFIALPTPPPEYDLEAWLASIERLRAHDFEAINLTHFGTIDAPAAHFDRLATTLRDHAQFIRERFEAGDAEDAIVDAYRAWYQSQADAAGVDQRTFGRFVSKHVVAMNVSGVVRYLKKRAEAAKAGPA